MSPLVSAQYMAAASFFTVGLIYALVWSRRPHSGAPLLFALAAVAAGGNAIAESYVYRALTVETMAAALKWYVGMSGLWLLALIWFIVAYSGVGRMGRWIAVGLSVIFFAALVVNYLAPYSFLYSDLDDLRVVNLPWGEQIRLPDGDDSPWRLATEVTIVGVFLLVGAGCVNLWRKGQKARAGLFGTSILLFMVCFGTHAFLVDTGRLDSPYISTYGFLAVVLVMGHDLAGRVMEASGLAAQLNLKEAELRTAVAEERSRIASDLHDSVTQTLFSTAAIADALPEVWTRYPEEARRGLEDLRQLTKGALAEMRALLLELRPAALLDKSLGELLVQLADATVGRTRTAVTAKVNCDRPLPEDVQIGLYRVAQEALNNVIRHARAEQATLDLSGDSRKVILTISDDGRGFAPEPAEPGRLGLQIMRERVHTLGADLKVNSELGEGTTVEVIWSDTPNRDSHG